MIENLILATEHLVGFLIVLIVLSLLWALTALIGRLMAPRGRAQAAPVDARAAAVSDEAADFDEEDLVVVAATVASMLDARHRIVSIRPQATSWGQQGRREIHASHRIR